MAKGFSINQWAAEDRPREKMAEHGASVLSDAELLAILIGSGTTDESAVGLMRRVLGDCENNLNSLGKLGVKELSQYKGIGPAKAITIMAACELGRRRAETDARKRLRMDKAETIYQFLLPKMQDLPHEECWVLLLNNSLRVIGLQCISRGGLTETSVDVRCLLREALLVRATAMVLSHNHPSGNVRPSREDDRITERVQKACTLMGIKLLDHLIVADGVYYSYNEEGRI